MNRGFLKASGLSTSSSSGTAPHRSGMSGSAGRLRSKPPAAGADVTRLLRAGAAALPMVPS